MSYIISMSIAYEITYYRTENGEKPAKEWLNGLRDTVARTKVHIRLDRAKLGNFGDTRSLGDGVNEIKINFGPGYRIYYAIDGKNIILLLLGGDKSTQAKDITRSKEFWKDHKRRK